MKIYTNMTPRVIIKFKHKGVELNLCVLKFDVGILREFQTFNREFLIRKNVNLLNFGRINDIKIGISRNYSFIDENDKTIYLGKMRAALKELAIRLDENRI